MWINYFYEIQKKYSMQISKTKTLVIRLDGKDVTKDENINFLANNVGSFSHSLEIIASSISRKYDCYCLFGTDEISFIVQNPEKFLNEIQTENEYFSNEIISVFSQYFFYHFNQIYKKGEIFWHGKCFSINENKITSCVKYRSGAIKNVLTTYFLKKNNLKLGNKNIITRINECKKFRDYPVLENAMYGTLYYCGEKLNIHSFLNGKIERIEENKLLKENIVTNIDENFEIDIDID